MARSVALFVHLLGVVTLFVAMGLVQRAGARIRSAASIEELRLWAGLARTTGPMWPASFLLIIASGLFMAGRFWSFTTPFVVVGIVSLVIMGALGGGVVGRSLEAIGRAADGPGSITPDLARLVARPAPWVAATTLNALAIGVLWLMVNKPGWGQSIAVQAGLALVGVAAGLAIVRRPAARITAHSGG